VLCQIFDNNFPDDVTRFHTLGCSAQTRNQLPRFWGTDGTDGEVQEKVDAGLIMKADTIEELADKRASLLTTIDGLRINEKAQVLAAGTMTPIEGLYAAGDCSGSFFANNYPELFPGVALGRSMTEALKAVSVISGVEEWK
jgi:hypothetical protein